MCVLTARCHRYALVLLFVAALAFLNLVFAVKFNAQQNNAWVLSVLVGCFAGTPARRSRGAAGFWGALRVLHPN
jgi:hypothetical protein